MEEEQRKRGRPRVNGAKRDRLAVRISEENKQVIEQACRILGVSVTDFLIDNCVKKAEEYIKKQERKFSKGAQEYEFYYDEDFEDEDFID